MSVKVAGSGSGKWIAFDSANGCTEYFESYEDAEEWLIEECNDGMISAEAETGCSYIAKITHRTAMKIIDSKGNYHEHTDDYPENCDKEEWPYGSEYGYIGHIYMKQLDDELPKN